MDFWKALRELHLERQRLDTLIANLEALRRGSEPAATRRGRKSMPADERQVVSQRMRAYWAKRRGSAASA